MMSLPFFFLNFSHPDENELNVLTSHHAQVPGTNFFWFQEARLFLVICAVAVSVIRYHLDILFFFQISDLKNL